MKVILKIVSFISILAVIGYVVYLQFFGINAEVKELAASLNEEVESLEYSYTFAYPTSTNGYVTYEYNTEVIKYYADGKLIEEYSKDSEEFNDKHEYVVDFIKYVDMSEENFDYEIINDLEFDGMLFEGEWYEIKTKGGCQSASCHVRGIAGDDVYYRYLKTDGKGYVSSSGLYIIIEE